MFREEIKMNREESIQKFLVTKFPFLEGKTRLQRARRVYADVDYSDFRQVLEYAVKELDFVFLCTMTGLDEGENFSLIYHLTRQDGVILSISTRIPKNKPVLKTITDIFKGCEIYEREVVDLLGIQVEGLPPGKRYPLPDDWPEGQYPLRKDWSKNA
jgi:Ni,Fe-hydrogenase III component G